MSSAYDKEKLKVYISEYGCELFLYDEIDSTNTEAKRYALSGGKCPAAFIADTQTSGRGRMGRSFYSPEGTGIYLSLLLPIHERSADVLRLTSAAAVAIRSAVFRMTGRDTKIKWVNDLYYNEKKIAGILCESFFSDGYGFLTVGVGINLCTESFPPEIAHTAGSLSAEGEGLRQALAAECVRELFRVWHDLGAPYIMDEYRRHSAVLGKEITYTENGKSLAGTAESIDDCGRLYVRDGAGTLHTLASGEISVKVR